jgi:hypothetical protein
MCYKRLIDAADAHSENSFIYEISLLVLGGVRVRSAAATPFYLVVWWLCLVRARTLFEFASVLTLFQANERTNAIK